MAKDQIDRADRLFQFRRLAQKVGHQRQMAAVPVAQRARIVADDMEHPESQRRPAQMLRNVTMRAGDQIKRRLQHRVPGEIGGGHGLPLDIVDHQGTRRMVQHGRRDPCRMGSTACVQLVKAHDLMHRNVVANPHHGAAGLILHQKIQVGNAAAKGLGHDRPLPDRQRQHLFHGRHRGPSRFSRCCRAG